ncbi:MAG: hypothetical protein JWR83_1058, partial [Aeromicrobium sp.]|nr:hypothetical protein [Aeromicrobium sp.]
WDVGKGRRASRNDQYGAGEQQGGQSGKSSQRWEPFLIPARQQS